MEKNKKKDIYVYLNNFAVYLKLIQYCKSTTFQLKNWLLASKGDKLDIPSFNQRSKLLPWERRADV